jgi:hypothetical protein
MISQLTSCAVLVLLGGCFGAHPALPTDSYQPSRILTLKRIAIMDTVTAVLDGQVVSLCNQQPLPASVQLTSTGKIYRTTATPDGRFCFLHIPSGTYLITATHPAYGRLTADTVRLGTGDCSTIKIGLGCHISSLPQTLPKRYD